MNRHKIDANAIYIHHTDGDIQEVKSDNIEFCYPIEGPCEVSFYPLTESFEIIYDDNDAVYEDVTSDEMYIDGVVAREFFDVQTVVTVNPYIQKLKDLLDSNLLVITLSEVVEANIANVPNRYSFRFYLKDIDNNCKDITSMISHITGIRIYGGGVIETFGVDRHSAEKIIIDKLEKKLGKTIHYE